MIDDNPLDHLILDKMLQKYGYKLEMLHYFDVRSVLKLLLENKGNPEVLPDLILIDLNMPKVNGWKFLDRYKKVESQLAKHVDIYILTSSIDMSDLNKSKNYSCVKSYLIKPITKNVLDEILH